MANASLKWNSHVTGLLEKIENAGADEDKYDDEDI
jgi:hypothetical protein